MSTEILCSIASQIRAAVALDEHAHGLVLIADRAPSLRSRHAAVLCLRAEELILIADAIDAIDAKAKKGGRP